jgi:hypothetical protein
VDGAANPVQVLFLIFAAMVIVLSIALVMYVWMLAPAGR